MLQGELTKCQGDWQIFLKNNGNKFQLIRLVLRVLGDDEVAEKYKDRKLTKCVTVRSPDTHMFLILLHHANTVM